MHSSEQNFERVDSILFISQKENNYAFPLLLVFRSILKTEFLHVLVHFLNCDFLFLKLHFITNEKDDYI